MKTWYLLRVRFFFRSRQLTLKKKKKHTEKYGCVCVICVLAITTLEQKKQRGEVWFRRKTDEEIANALTCRVSCSHFSLHLAMNVAQAYIAYLTAPQLPYSVTTCNVTSRAIQSCCHDVDTRSKQTLSVEGRVAPCIKIST